MKVNWTFRAGIQAAHHNRSFRGARRRRKPLHREGPQVLKIVLATGEVSALAGTFRSPGSVDGIGQAARLSDPGLTADGAGKFYLTETANNLVRKLVIATGEVTTLVGRVGQAGFMPGPLPALLNKPVGIVAVPTGQLFVTDQAENAVLLVR